MNSNIICFSFKISKYYNINNIQEKKKERIKELKKLKQDKQSRRKEILEQINNDRKERESRNNSLSGGSGSNSSESLQKLMSQKPKSTNNGDEITMSVRYLDGSLLRQDFKRTQKLSDIRKWVDDVMFIYIYYIYKYIYS